MNICNIVNKNSLTGVNIVLGVTGSIAAYKAILLLRELIKAGACVTPVMTENATRFISPVTFSSLSKQDVAISSFTHKEGGFIRHVELAGNADLLIIAPATANIIGKAAAGIADDFLSTLYIATACPVIFAPAMNYRMYAHFQVQENIKTLKKAGVVLVGPDSGDLACGEGPGRMSDPKDILNAVVGILSGEFSGKTVLITAGPTREYIDPIRFISNESSGRIGFALAAEAQRRGARVILVSGPTSLTPPAGVEVHNIVSAEEMYNKTVDLFSECDTAILTAAVGDFSVKKISSKKIKKENNGELILNFKKNKDILAELGRRRENRTLIGFCLETTSLMENAKKKMKNKNCSIIVANLHSEAGIGSGVGKVTVIMENGREIPLPAMPKDRLAKALWDTWGIDTNTN